jgi:CheY-like chemotaxis protein
VASRDKDSSGIFVVQSDGKELRRVYASGKRDSYPSWTADGKRIVFASNADGHSHIYVIGADGTGLRRLTCDAGENAYLSGSPDGRMLAFMSNRARAAPFNTPAIPPDSVRVPWRGGALTGSSGRSLNPTPDADLLGPAGTTPVLVPSTVLYVERESSLCRIASRFLSRAGFRVLVAQSRTAVLDALLFDEHGVELVVTQPDIQDLNIIALMSVARSQSIKAKFLVTSDGGLPDYLVDLVNAGAVGFLPKPWSFQQLEEEIKRMLRP